MSTRKPLRDEEVRVTAGPVSVAGHLTIPEHPTGIVVFAHGSKSSRHSPRNRLVDVTRWLAGQPDTAALPVGYFGASTGAGAALVAATDPRVRSGPWCPAGAGPIWRVSLCAICTPDATARRRSR